MKTLTKYFTGSFLFTFAGLILSYFIGVYYTGTTAGGLKSVFLVFVLSILEVSISFDNAVVNATVLKDMTPLWQKRFLTWGMLIAVFGMRLVFPLLIVGVVAHLNPWDALVMAALDPQKYAEIMLSVHVEIAAYGGAFLFMVALKYFFDHEKEVHWISFIEKPLSKLGKLQAVEIGFSLFVLYIVSTYLKSEHQYTFLISGIFGLLTFIAVDGIGTFLKVPDASIDNVHKASAGMFIYLEVLDASFSFDGVVGAFAITNNLFLIAVGLGIGAMFVRSLTILLVDKGTLNEFKFLEHGAFYAVGALGFIMFIGAVTHIPEIITGLVGAAFIGLSIVSSIQHRNKNIR